MVYRNNPKKRKHVHLKDILKFWSFVLLSQRKAILREKFASEGKVRT